MDALGIANELLEVGQHLTRAAPADFFDRTRPLTVARAPGRLDVMGGFADYSGSLTLEMPLREAAWVAVQSRGEPRVRVLSASFGQAAAPPRSAILPLGELRRSSSSYAAAGAYFKSGPAEPWAAYVLGALAALRVERGREVSEGLDVLLASSVPEGKGVSSSAAVEVASLAALSALYGEELGAEELALMCQRVENLVVGAPCGIMDQMTSSCALGGQLLSLLCQPAVLEGSIEVAPGLELWGVDSGLRHQVSGADYGSVRVAAFMGYRIVAAASGLSVRAAGPGRVEIEDPLYGGYLANVSPRQFETELGARLAERLTGAEFLQTYQGISDPITQVDPLRSYRVRAATAHPIYEHQRVRAFGSLMREAAGARSQEDLDDMGGRLGELMYAAHASYSACGLGSSGTDRLVELARELGPARGIYGAKITGGGSGGTVALLTRAGAGDVVRELAASYERDTGHAPQLFWGSSPGARAFGGVTAQFRAGAWQLSRTERSPG